MPIKSMTGFGRCDGHDEHCSWHWEMRCVNGKGLDIRARLPQGFEALDARVREVCKARLARGNCTVTLSVNRESRSATAKLNEDTLGEILEISKRAAEITGREPMSLEALLSMRGVIEYAEEEEDDAAREARESAIMADFDGVLDGVIASRTQEGERMSVVLAGLLKETAELVATIENAPARAPELITQKLRDQLDRILAEAPQLDEDRLHQEAMLLAAKADVEEELARLKAHIAAASDLLASDEPVGRKFDFLTQEFNREANTICSKSNDTGITQTGLALKTVIDRMREQVQNIE